MLKEKKILLLGAGAVGVYFLGRLSQCGIDCVFIGRSEYDYVKQHGYQVKSIAGDFAFQPEIIKESVELNGPADYIFITTKVLPDIDYRQLLAPAVGVNSVLVLIQNGIYIEEALSDAFPDNRIISAIAYIGVARTAPGHYSHTGGGELAFGDYPSGDSAELNEIVEAFSQAGVKVAKSSDIIKSRWSKLCWNASYNCVSVLGGHADTSMIMAQHESVELIEAIMREVEALSIADDHAIDSDTVERNIEYTRDFPPYKPSMLLDYEAGRRLELEAIVGNALKKAAEYDVKVPNLKAVYALLKLVSR